MPRAQRTGFRLVFSLAGSSQTLNTYCQRIASKLYEIPLMLEDYEQSS